MSEKQSEPIYKKLIEKRNDNTLDLKQSVAIVVNPYSMTQTNGKVSTGYTLSIKTFKAGYGKESAKTYSVNLNPCDSEVRKALEEALKAVDKVSK